MQFIPSPATCQGCEYVKIRGKTSTLQPYCRLARRSLSNILALPDGCPKQEKPKEAFKPSTKRCWGCVNQERKIEFLPNGSWRNKSTCTLTGKISGNMAACPQGGPQYPSGGSS